MIPVPPQLYVDFFNAAFQPVRDREQVGHDCKSLAAAVAMLRHHAGLSQWQLATRAATSQHTIYMLENGQRCRVHRHQIQALEAVARSHGFASLANVIRDRGGMLELEYRRRSER